MAWKGRWVELEVNLNSWLFIVEGMVLTENVTGMVDKGTIVLWTSVLGFYFWMDEHYQGKTWCEFTRICTTTLQLRPCVVLRLLNLLLTTYPVHQAAAINSLCFIQVSVPTPAIPLSAHICVYFLNSFFFSVLTSLYVFFYLSLSVSKEDLYSLPWQSSPAICPDDDYDAVMIVILVSVTTVVRRLVVVLVSAALV